VSSFPGVTQLLIVSRLPSDVFQIADAVVFMSPSGCWGRLCLSLTTADSSVSCLCWLPAHLSSTFMTLHECVLCFQHMSSGCTFSLSVDLQYLCLCWSMMCNMILCWRVIQCFVGVLYLAVFL
jgi:hypothetical protein